MGISRRSYINQVLNLFNLKNCSLDEAPLTKEDKYFVFQYPKIDIEKDSMQDMHYASVAGRLMNAQVCKHPDISYVVT